MSDVVIAYFSATGHTAELAGRIAEAASAAGLNADLVEILPCEPYTEADLNWHDLASRSSIESKDDLSIRPAIEDDAASALAGCRLLFLGSPIWWGNEAPVIRTFLDAHRGTGRLDGVALVPFVSSGGSGVGPVEENLRRMVPEARVLPGKRLRSGDDVAQLQRWIAELAA